MKIKKRLDVLLTERGLADTRTKAQAIIMSGRVYVEGQKADKPGVSYEENVDIEVRTGGCPYVSRGGLKLEKHFVTSAFSLLGMYAVIPAHPQAALPIACCSRVPVKCLLLMWVTVSWTGRSVPIPGSWLWSAPMCAM